LPVLVDLFSRYGYPGRLICDNGPEFISQAFTDYCDSIGVPVTHTTPYIPHQNGLTEVRNKPLVKSITISHALGQDWETELPHILQYLRETPHPVTGEKPAEVFFKRQI